MVTKAVNAPGAAGIDHDARAQTIEQVSRLLDVPASTLRSWERRYNIPSVSRNAGGHRRYNAADIALLQLLRSYIAAGHRPSAAAALVKESQHTSPARIVESYVQASYDLKHSEVRRSLDHAAQLFGLERTVDEVLLPALRDIGDRWAAGAFDVACEHVATEATKTWLANASRNPEAQPSGKHVLLACAPLELHTLALESLSVLLTRRGISCVTLGAQTPAASLARAAAHLGPSALVVVAHLSTTRQSAVEALHAASDNPALLFYAGNVFRSRRARQSLPGTYLGEHLGRAADTIHSAINQQIP